MPGNPCAARKITLSTCPYDDHDSFFVGLVYAVTQKPKLLQTLYIKRTADVIVTKQKGAKAARGVSLAQITQPKV